MPVLVELSRRMTVTSKEDIGGEKYYPKGIYKVRWIRQQ